MPIETPPGLKEPSTPSTATSRRSSSQLQPLRPTRLFQLGAPSSTNSTSPSVQSSRHGSIVTSPTSEQVPQSGGKFSLPNLRNIGQYPERSEASTPTAATEMHGQDTASHRRGAITPLMGPLDRAVQSFQDLRLNTGWEKSVLKPDSVQRREAERCFQNKDFPKSQSTTSLWPGPGPTFQDVGEEPRHEKSTGQPSYHSRIAQDGPVLQSKQSFDECETVRGSPHNFPTTEESYSDHAQEHLQEDNRRFPTVWSNNASYSEPLLDRNLEASSTVIALRIRFTNLC